MRLYLFSLFYLCRLHHEAIPLLMIITITNLYKNNNKINCPSHLSALKRTSYCHIVDNTKQWRSQHAVNLSIFVRKGHRPAIPKNIICFVLFCVKAHKCICGPVLWSVFGGMLSLLVTTFLGLLGNGTGHRPGSLSGKWNPESRSQTQNHAFILFIHSLSCGVPDTEPGAGGEREKKKGYRNVCVKVLGLVYNWEKQNCNVSTHRIVVLVCIWIFLTYRFPSWK